MKRILAFLFLGFALGVAQRHVLFSQSTPVIEGIVLDKETDRPLSGVTVSAVSGANTGTAMTDAQGHFAVSVPDSGRYLLITTHEGMTYARIGSPNQPHEPGSWVQVSSGEHITDISLRMQAAGVITGRVLDSNGKTFSAARGTVSVMRNFYDDYGKKQLQSDAWVHFDRDTNNVGRMDDKGDYRLYGLQPGDYYVSANGGGSRYYYPGTPDEALAKPVHVRSGEEVHLSTIILPAQTTTQVRFHLSGSAGNPLPSGNLISFTLLSPDGWGQASLSGKFLPPAVAPVVTSMVRSVSLQPGPYDFVVGLKGDGASPDMQYGHIRLNVGNTDLDEFLMLSQGIRVTGDISAMDANGKSTDIPGLLCKLHSDLPHIESLGATKGCFGAQYSSGLYQLGVTGMPPDAYIESAAADGKDILVHGLPLDTNTEIKVRIRALGGRLEGVVKDADGKAVPEAAVALVPDEPLRNAGTFYRFVTSDVHGKYQLRGIAPGSYHLFAWAELDGAAYRNAEFMRDYYELGTPVTVDSSEHPSLNIQVLN